MPDKFVVVAATLKMRVGSSINVSRTVYAASALRCRRQFRNADLGNLVMNIPRSEHSVFSIA